MAEMNLNQITDKLNAEFMGDARKLVFWYDNDAEFADDVDSLPLENAKVLHLEEDNQFYIKYFLEYVDKDSSYLVYAPFAKPDIRENHLADTILYSKEFFADRASLIALDLGIDERLKPVIQKYIKFFASKERIQKFYDLEVDVFRNEAMIETALMSVLCRSRICSFEEVVRCILTEDDLDDSRFLAEFGKYGLLDAFWEHTGSVFGYLDAKPTLKKFTATMLITYTSKSIYCDVPSPWKSFLSHKAGNITAFIDGIMNSTVYGAEFDKISEAVFREIKGEAAFSKMLPEDIADCYAFSGIDDIIIRWITERLENEDTGARLGNRSIPEICIMRRKRHFGSKRKAEYFALEHAWYLVSMDKYEQMSGLDNIADAYVKHGYMNDMHYRYFYYYYDMIEDTEGFEKLRVLAEKIYTNEYLNKVTVNWSSEFTASQGSSGIVKQTEFFSKYVRPSKERTVVIISDAMRYEVGQTLFEKLSSDEKCKASIVPMQSVLPSYTRLGMAALLPHRGISLGETYQTLAGGKACDDIKQREAILQSENENSRAVQYDDIKGMSVAELRDVFSGQDTVYVYHNQIDARGDKAISENEVFTSCEEAVDEIYKLIKRLATSANTAHCIVTADHGFIYKRDKLSESDKIGNVSGMSGAFVGKRYLISDEAVTGDGTLSVPVKAILGGDDERIISFPMGSDIFKTAGSGLNYVHGGCSPQEMIVPVIDVKTDKGRKETVNARIELMSILGKITNLITMVDFVQPEPVSDVVKEASYRIYFVSENGDAISNENILLADKKDSETIKRTFRLKFSFKNRQYGIGEKYYLVAFDEKNDLEVLRHEVVMDIAFADDFGF